MTTIAEQDSGQRAGVFVIAEQTGPRATFTWTSDRRPPANERGGARACPIGPWTIAATLRTKRTEYPGATSPSEQVMGPQQDAQQFSGVLDDRYNYTGYAVETMRALEDMCRRGGMVAISFQAQSFVGIVTGWRFDYKRSSEIGYEITFSAHKRSEWVDHKPGQDSPRTVVEVVAIIDEMAQQMLAAMNEADKPSMIGDVGAKSPELIARDNVAAVSAQRDALASTVTQQTVNAAYNPMVTLGSIAANARELQTKAHATIVATAGMRADAVIRTKSAMAVLNFEVWSRSLRNSARLLMGKSIETANAADERADPAVKRVYRPHKGESLYAISNREYGTPHAWRLIADRNGLRTMTLTGDELLLIPERGEAP